MPPTRRIRLLAFLLLLAACGPQNAPRLRLVADGETREIAAGGLVPARILADAGIAFSPADRALVNGIPVPMDLPIPSGGLVTLQLRRARTVRLAAPTVEMTLASAAFTVGEALREAGVNLYVSDRVEPPPDSPLAEGMTITIAPGRELVVRAGGGTTRIHSSAATVGQALAEAGIPLVGLDSAAPSENEALPADGQIRVVRVAEVIESAYTIIPYETQLIVTAELQPPAQDVLEPGEAGISLSRTRIRYEDGVEAGRAVESESVIRLPRARVARSSFWAAKEMYATSYSPCRSGGSGCSYGTSSGMRAGYGVVALSLAWYRALKGARVYVPGYGFGVVGDVCPGCTGKAWIDLGYDDGNYVGWSSWVTVYFLPPAPLEIPWFLK